MSLILLVSPLGIAVIHTADMANKLKAAEPTIVLGPNSPLSKWFPVNQAHLISNFLWNQKIGQIGINIKYKVEVPCIVTFYKLLGDLIGIVDTVLLYIS